MLISIKNICWLKYMNFHSYYWNFFLINSYKFNFTNLYHIKMKIVKIILKFGIIFLYNLIYMFIELGGIQYLLLKIIFEMLFIIIIMKLYRYKKDKTNIYLIRLFFLFIVNKIVLTSLIPIWIKPQTLLVNITKMIKEKLKLNILKELIKMVYLFLLFVFF